MAKIKIKEIPSKIKIIKEIKSDSEESELEKDVEDNSFNFHSSSSMPSGLNSSGQIVRETSQQVNQGEASKLRKEEVALKYESPRRSDEDKRMKKYNPSTENSSTPERSPIHSQILAEERSRGFAVARQQEINESRRSRDVDFQEDETAKKYREGDSDRDRKRKFF